MPEFDYSPEELDYFESELRQYRLPWISRVWKKIGVPFLRYSFLPAIILIVILGAIYNGSAFGVNDWIWGTIKGIAFFYIFGVGVLALIGHLAERISANALRKKLGLSHHHFKMLVEAHQITGM